MVWTIDLTLVHTTLAIGEIIVLNHLSFAHSSTSLSVGSNTHHKSLNRIRLRTRRASRATVSSSLSSLKRRRVHAKSMRPATSSQLLLSSEHSEPQFERRLFRYDVVFGTLALRSGGRYQFFYGATVHGNRPSLVTERVSFVVQRHRDQG